MILPSARCYGMVALLVQQNRPAEALAMAEQTSSQALRSAGLELLKRPQHQHPFYWASFVLVGTNQAIVTRPP